MLALGRCHDAVLVHASRPVDPGELERHLPVLPPRRQSAPAARVAGSRYPDGPDHDTDGEWLGGTGGHVVPALDESDCDPSDWLCRGQESMEQTGMSAIEFQGVSKRYGDRAPIDGLSFRIDEGERVVVHGPSGCGKTTVLRLVAGFLVPD